MLTSYIAATFIKLNMTQFSLIKTSYLKIECICPALDQLSSHIPVEVYSAINVTSILHKGAISEKKTNVFFESRNPVLSR